MNITEVSKVLDAITEAKTAFERIPALELQISSHESTIRHNDTTIANQAETISTQAERLRELENQIATLKGERDEARFQQLVAEEEVGKFRGLLKSVVDVAGSAVAEPAPSPVEPSGEVKAKETQTTLGAYLTNEENNTFADGLVPSSPTPQAQPEPAPATPSDGFSPGHFNGWSWWNRPSYISQERFVELGGDKYPYNEVA